MCMNDTRRSYTLWLAAVSPAFIELSLLHQAENVWAERGSFLLRIPLNLGKNQSESELSSRSSLRCIGSYTEFRTFEAHLQCSHTCSPREASFGQGQRRSPLASSPTTGTQSLLRRLSTIKSDVCSRPRPGARRPPCSQRCRLEVKSEICGDPSRLRLRSFDVTRARA
jgi:hypothetical protein